MLSPQQYQQAILVLSQAHYNDLLEENADRANGIADKLIAFTVNNHEPLGANILGMSFALAQLTGDLIEETSKTTGHSAGNIIMTPLERQSLLFDACIATIGKLVGHFTHASIAPFDERMN